MGYLCEMFDYWRGDIIFRFKFICTRFHKGRVRITFDPTGDISATVPDYTTVFNEVLDIGAEQDIEVRVPYMQAVTYLRTAIVVGNYNLAGGAIAPNSVVANGLITMRVVNPLSGPVANTAIPVMVFVRAAENIEFAQPNIRVPKASLATPFALQSAEVEYAVAPIQVIAGHKTSDGDPQRNLVHFGERIVSLRPLIHRLAYQYSQHFTTTGASDTMFLRTARTSRRFKFAGFDTNAYWTGVKVVGIGNSPYQYQKMNVHQLVSLLFIGQRGSMNWQFDVETNNTGMIPNLSLKRSSDTVVTSSDKVESSRSATTYSLAAYDMVRLTSEPGSGTALTDQRGLPSIAMNFPFYSNYNFQFTKPSLALRGSQLDGSAYDNIELQAFMPATGGNSPCRVNAWAGCGPDYNFFFFINAPSLYTTVVPLGI